MQRPPRRLRDAATVASAIAVSALLVLVVGFAFFGWGLEGSSRPSNYSPLPHLAITFAADDNAEVQFLLTDIRPYVEPGDSFDLVSGSPEGNSSTNVSHNINRWTQELRTVYPGYTMYAHTAGLANFAVMAGEVRSNVSGVVYDYEPNFEPEFTFNFTQTVSSFENATALAHAAGLLSVGYPIGRPLLQSSLQQYGWNYAALALAVDRLVIQIQTYCVQGPSEYAAAVEKAIDEYAAAGLTSLPTFQITIGNSTTNLPNGVTAGPAYNCTEELVNLGNTTLYLWWDQGGESNLVAFLQDLGRG